jgi:hypothetical protein
MMSETQVAFEKWCDRSGLLTTKSTAIPLMYWSFKTQLAWELWQSAIKWERERVSKTGGESECRKGD